MQWVMVDVEDERVVYLSSRDDQTVSVPITLVLQIVGAKVSFEEHKEPLTTIYVRSLHKWRAGEP